MEKYIHYGHTKFEKDFFVNISNKIIATKPISGFWALSINAEYGWKDWCTDTGFREIDERDSFTFKLSQNARVLHIDSSEDLKDLPKIECQFEIFSWTLLDFEKLANEYDAIEVKNISCDPKLYLKLFGWDCDSILIMNPDIIEEC